MRRAVDAARMLRESNPVADDAFAGAAGDSLGRATFDAIIDHSAEPAQAVGRFPGLRRPFWLAAVAVGVAVVAVAAVVVPGALLSGAGGPVAYAANVVKGVNTALTRADSGTFAQMTVTTTVAPVIAGNPMAHGKTTTTTAEEWSYGNRWRSVTNSAAGHPVFGEGFGPSSGYTLVSYKRRTWASLAAGAGRPAGSSFGAPGCGRVSAAGPVLFQPTLPGTGLAPKSLLTVARTLHAAVACGTLDVAARQRFDGVEAIKLTSGQKSLIAETVWVSAGTYLPMRVVIRSLPGRSLVIEKDMVLRQTADFTWLPPTTRNLARLTVPIPAGFRRIPYAQAVWPIAQQLPGGLPLAAAGPGYSGQHRGNLQPYRHPQKPS
jgi:hypothetical protein